MLVNVPLRLNHEVVERIDHLREQMDWKVTRCTMLRWLIEDHMSALEKKLETDGDIVRRATL
jgi:hypothetical protein